MFKFVSVKNIGVSSKYVRFFTVNSGKFVSTLNRVKVDISAVSFAAHSCKYY